MWMKRPEHFLRKAPASAGVLFWIELILWVKVIFLVVLVGNMAGSNGEFLKISTNKGQRINDK